MIFNIVETSETIKEIIMHRWQQTKGNKSLSVANTKNIIFQNVVSYHKPKKIICVTPTQTFLVHYDFLQDPIEKNFCILYDVINEGKTDL